jgi:hypothetical protein
MVVLGFEVDDFEGEGYCCDLLPDLFVVIELVPIGVELQEEFLELCLGCLCGCHCGVGLVGWVVKVN